MSLLSMLGLVGCNFSTTEKDNEKVIEFLNKKYNKEFKISENLHKWGAPLEESKAKQGTAYCVDSPDEIFSVFLTDDGICKDGYQNITMKQYVQEYYENILKEYWPECKIGIKLKYGETENKYTKEECLSYLVESKLVSELWIFIPTNANVNNSEEAKRINSLTSELKNSGLVIELSCNYILHNVELNPEMFLREHLWGKYKEDGTIICHLSENINQDDNLLSIEEVKQNLEKNN